MKWNTSEFKELQQAWYAKLAEDGFEDAEEVVAGDLVLKQTSEVYWRYERLEPVQIAVKEEYFQVLTERVREAPFASKVDRIILLLRSDGAKIQQIANTLSFLGKRRCRGTIRYTIRKYEMEWGMRAYSPRQLNKKVRRTA